MELSTPFGTSVIPGDGLDVDDGVITEDGSGFSSVSAPKSLPVPVDLTDGVLVGETDGVPDEDKLDTDGSTLEEEDDETEAEVLDEADGFGLEETEGSELEGAVLFEIETIGETEKEEIGDTLEEVFGFSCAAKPSSGDTFGEIVEFGSGVSCLAKSSPEFLPIPVIFGDKLVAGSGVGVLRRSKKLGDSAGGVVLAGLGDAKDSTAPQAADTTSNPRLDKF